MLKEIIEKIMRYENLSIKEAYDAMEYIMDGNSNESQVASFLTAMGMKEPNIDEISGFSRAMLAKAKKLTIRHKNIVDTCGTGGDRKNTFNISTTAAFIAAGAGVIIAKHGNRSVSSKSGSADVLEELGVNLNIELESVANCIDDIGIGFIFAPKAHTAMKNVAKVRKDLGIKTIFNILGPLTNPAMANGRVLGVFDQKLMDLMVYSLKNLGVKRAFVVHGLETLDEFSVSGKSMVAELSDGKVNKYILDPEELGFRSYCIDDLRGGGPAENAKILMQILTGEEKGAKRDSSILNASAAIVAGGKAHNLKEAVSMAADSIDSGNALKKLNQLIEYTNKF
ncbi:MAG: anthranilate phosphoribosyltransferase [Candidatus Humimicrobiaceae bacterium]